MPTSHVLNKRDTKHQVNEPLQNSCIDQGIFTPHFSGASSRCQKNSLFFSQKEHSMLIRPFQSSVQHFVMQCLNKKLHITKTVNTTMKYTIQS